MEQNEHMEVNNPEKKNPQIQEQHSSEGGTSRTKAKDWRPSSQTMPRSKHIHISGQVGTNH